MGGIGNLFEMMKNAKQMMEKAKEAKEVLAKKTAEGGAGAGLVYATVNGLGELISLKFEPVVVNPDDPEMLADLIVAAVADARKKAESLRADAMRDLTGGVDLSSLGIDLGSIM